MPETQEYNEHLQQMMENLRNRIEQLRNRRWERLTKDLVEEVPEEKPIEEIPQQEETVEISWLTRPRTRNHGWFTNLNKDSHVEIRDNGGQIN